MKKRKMQERVQRRISNLVELRRLKDLHGFDVLEFSDLHFRIIGKIAVDYWPSRGTVWPVGCKGRGIRMDLSEVCKLVLGAGEISNAQMDAEFRSILQ